MSQLDDEVTVVVTNKPDSELYAVFEESNFDVNVGESGALQVSEGIQYIQSGKKEIGEAVAEVKAEITAHATQKTAEFDENAEQKTNNFNANATAKTQAFNTNATEKTNTFNQNASSLTADFNNNAATKTSDFERLAFDETADFERTVIESTDAFNDLFDRSRQIIREDVDQAATYAGNAYNYSNEAKKWAIGDPSEPAGYSSKYWAEASASAAATVGNGTITLTQGGVTKGTFTTNQSGNTTIDVDAATIPSNMVTTDTTQTITGLKTFTENNIIKNTYPFVEISNSTLTKGTNPTTTQYAGILFEDKDANGQTSTRLGDLVLSVDSSGNVTNAFKAWNYNGSGSAAIRVIYPTNGTPYATAPAPTEDTTSSTQIDTVGARNTKLQNYALSSSLATVATSGSYNDLTDKPTIPTKTSDLTNDSGYITGISSSDVTTALGYTPANDSDVVKTRGNQNIGGNKTFTSGIVRTSLSQTAQISLGHQYTTVTKGTAPSTNVNSRWRLYDKDGTGNANSICGVDMNYNTNGSTSISLNAYKPESSSTINSGISVTYPATGDPYTSAPTPTSSDNSTKIATTAYVHGFFSAISGYDMTKTQTLKNVNGTLTWVTD